MKGLKNLRINCIDTSPTEQAAVDCFLSAIDRRDDRDEYHERAVKNQAVRDIGGECRSAKDEINGHPVQRYVRDNQGNIARLKNLMKNPRQYDLFVQDELSRAKRNIENAESKYAARADAFAVLRP